MVGGVVVENEMASFGIVAGDVMPDFGLDLNQSGEATAIEQFRLEATPKRFGVGRIRQGVVVAVSVPAHALQRTMFGDQVFDAGGCGRPSRMSLNQLGKTLTRKLSNSKAAVRQKDVVRKEQQKAWGNHRHQADNPCR